MLRGTIVEIVADQYTVNTEIGDVFCQLRGRLRLKDVTPLVGDLVVVSVHPEGVGTIDDILERRNFIQRPAIANVNQAIVVFAATEPKPNWLLIDRILVIAEQLEIAAIVVCNKAELGPTEELLEPYKRAGYPTFAVSARTGKGVDSFVSRCMGKISVLAGQSGVGKSSLLNCIFPQIELETQNISKKRGFGRHTTTRVKLIGLSEGGFIADTPGFNRLDLTAITPSRLAAHFPEMRSYLGECRFGISCLHHKEPDCAVKKACEQGEISTQRYQRYLMILDEMLEKERMRYK